jgi:hypothetical protein
MNMRRRASGARVGGWISEEAGLARSMAELDLNKPGWDDEARLLGVVRRLERDPTAKGVQAAIDVYGKDSVYEAMPCAGLRVVGGVVIGSDDKPVYVPSLAERRSVLLKSRNREPDFVSGANLSVRETEVLLAIANGNNTRDIAARMGLSLHAVMNLRGMVMKKVKAALARREASADADAHIRVEE